jgi:23S rRNA (guanosine2251-2'-O)-methyltransferase
VKSRITTPQTYTVYGLNSAKQVLKAGRFEITAIDICKNCAAEKDPVISALLEETGIALRSWGKEKFTREYKGYRTQGIAVSFKGPVTIPLPSFANGKKNMGILLGDHISDPQNLGQIIRTAECAGLDGLILPERGGTQLTNAALQVSQGAFVTLPIYSCGNVQQTLQQLKDDGFWIVGVENDDQAKIWYEVDYSGKVAIVVGSEGQGIRQLVRRRCDFLATIPMQGQINSLNVSAAVSAVLFERQRQINV